ncbi:MAG: c-type cytochrome [Deltaproteobacteria bacterium]|nr:c-type cytochrome [Deltaproteobacteria bacterium]
MKKVMIGLLAFAVALPAVALANPAVEFNSKCAICHRANANLPRKAKQLDVDPGKLTLQTSKMSREEMIAITEKGKDKMPGFEQELTREQIETVVDYIIALKNRKK